MPVIGFSTGALAFDDFARALQLIEPTRANAVELSALRASELPDLLSAIPLHIQNLRRRYKYVSFHAPTNFSDEGNLVVQLTEIAKAHLNIIVHPDTIQNVSLWRVLGDKLCLENMDSRKNTGRTVEELSPFFADLPEAKLCFDIAHARQIDPTMTEADRILDRFGDRLAQIHISEVDSRGKHFAMSFSAKRAYEPFAEILSSVPIIIESVIAEDEILPEIETVEHIISRQTWDHTERKSRPRTHDLEIFGH